MMDRFARIPLSQWNPTKFSSINEPVYTSFESFDQGWQLTDFSFKKDLMATQIKKIALSTQGIHLVEFNLDGTINMTY